MLLCQSQIAVFAMNTGLETESAQAGTAQQLQAKIKLVKREPKKESFSCFAVNENGMIAIAFRKMRDTIKVRVYNKEGVFQYGYDTDFEQGIEIEWDEKTNHVFMTGPATTVFEGEIDYV